MRRPFNRSRTIVTGALALLALHRRHRADAFSTPFSKNAALFDRDGKDGGLSSYFSGGCYGSRTRTGTRTDAAVDDGDGDVGDPAVSERRRQVLLQSSAAILPLVPPAAKARADDRAPLPRGTVFEVEDPSTYSAVAYVPPPKRGSGGGSKDGAGDGVERLPLLVVLHGAGNNERSALQEFTEEGGDHANLPPYLLSSGSAPSALSDNFVVVAPYVGRGKRSLYDEPRSTILSFVKWFNSWLDTQTVEGVGAPGAVAVDRRKVSLFGFSEGSTLAVELATTRQFNGVVLASYGFTGSLPKMAVQRLQGIPIWAFHSRGDDVYDIKCSDRLVEALVTYEGGGDVFGVSDIIKYTKLVPGGGSGKGYEHVRSALVASKSDEVYTWLLSLQ